MDDIRVEGPLSGLREDCERVLRTLPQWFGIEEPLVEYARNTDRLPTFVVREGVSSSASCRCASTSRTPGRWTASR